MGNTNKKEKVKNIITADLDTSRVPKGRRPKKVVVDDSKALFTRKFIINDKNTTDVIQEVAQENGVNPKVAEITYISVFNFIKDMMEDSYNTDVPHCLLINKFGKFYSSDKQITSYRKKKGYGRL